MSDSQTVPDPTSAGGSATATPPSGSFLGHLVGLFTEPRTAFASILRDPSRWWLPVLGCIVLNLIFTAVWTSKVDAHQFMRTQIEESGRADKIPADQLDNIVDKQAAFMKPFSWVVAVLIPIIGAVVLGAILMFVYRFFFEGEVRFAQSLSVVAWSSLALALVLVPIMLIVMAAKGDWNVDPNTVVGANLTLLLDKGQTAKWLYSLAGSLDLFSFWNMFLLACGFGVLIRKPTASALWGVLVPWAVWVLGKVALTALMS